MYNIIEETFYILFSLFEASLKSSVYLYLYLISICTSYILRAGKHMWLGPQHK